MNSLHRTTSTSRGGEPRQERGRTTTTTTTASGDVGPSALVVFLRLAYTERGAAYLEYSESEVFHHQEVFQHHEAFHHQKSTSFCWTSCCGRHHPPGTSSSSIPLALRGEKNKIPLKDIAQINYTHTHMTTPEVPPQRDTPPEREGVGFEVVFCR